MTVSLVETSYAEVFGQPSVDVSGVLTDANGLARVVTRTAKDVTALGDTELVAAQAGLKIRLLAFTYRSALAVVVRLKSAGNNLTASYSLGINDDLVWPYNPQGWLETNVGESLAVNQSLAIASGAQIVWIGVP